MYCRRREDEAQYVSSAWVKAIIKDDGSPINNCGQNDGSPINNCGQNDGSPIIIPRRRGRRVCLRR